MHNSPWQISLSFIFQQPHKLYDIFVQRGVYVMRVFLLLIHSAIRIRMQIWYPAAAHTHMAREGEGVEGEGEGEEEEGEEASKADTDRQTRVASECVCILFAFAQRFSGQRNF